LRKVVASALAYTFEAVVGKLTVVVEPQQEGEQLYYSY
jgi:hypothetical protein